PVRFVVADAAAHPLTPDWADLIVSRFGVMFFADPALAFGNLRRGLRRGGRMVFVCWREAKLNPFFVVPLRAAANHVPPLPELGPEDPGPFAFADPARVRRILDQAGFVDVDLEPHELKLDIAVGRGLEAAVEAALTIGPASRMLEDQSEAVRAAAAASVRAALAPHAEGDRVPLMGAIWIVRARNP
ncbi:MAG: methyltransferase domain-containing protein, partial [Hyphomicrobiales bacterium]|nr:methyltransferase domain-containing protein [Hyphomicrobiales bacterium]